MNNKYASQCANLREASLVHFVYLFLPTGRFNSIEPKEYCKNWDQDNMIDWPCFAQKFRYGFRIFFGFLFGFAGSRALQFFFGPSWALPAQVQAQVSVQLQQLTSSASADF